MSLTFEIGRSVPARRRCCRRPRVHRRHGAAFARARPQGVDRARLRGHGGSDARCARQHADRHRRRGGRARQGHLGCPAHRRRGPRPRGGQTIVARHRAHGDRPRRRRRGRRLRRWPKGSCSARIASSPTRPRRSCRSSRRSPCSVTPAGSGPSQTGADRGRAIGDAVAFARDLVNTPPAYLNARDIAEIATERRRRLRVAGGGVRRDIDRRDGSGRDDRRQPGQHRAGSTRSAHVLAAQPEGHRRAGGQGSHVRLRWHIA